MVETSPAPALVVGAALVRDGRLLAARRTRPPALAGRWELPGGRVEPLESPRAALQRELAEELGIDVSPTEPPLGGWPLPDGGALLVYLVGCGAGVDPRPVDHHDALRWLAADEVDEVPWVPADRPAVAAVLARLAGRPDRLAGPALDGAGA